MIKNTASQKVGAQMITAADGSAFTSAVTVYVTGDAGTQAAGSVGSGACTHEGQGYHTYAPATAETNYDLIAFTFTGTGAVPQSVQVYTRAATPDVNVSTIAANAITATAIASDAITDAKVASDVTIASVTGAVGSVTGAVGSVTGAVGSVTGAVGSVTGSVGSIATGGIAAASFAAGAIDAAALAADAGTEIGTAVWATATRTVTAATNITSTGGTTVPQTGDVYAIANSGTHGNAALKTLIDTVDTVVDTILVDTAELQTDWVNGGRLDLILDARSSQTSVDDLPTNAELATALGGADDAVLSAIAAVSTKVDAIDDYIDTEIADILTDTGTTLDDLIDLEIAAIKAKTDSLTFTVAGQVDANIQAVNDAALTGDGTVGTPWGKA